MINKDLDYLRSCSAELHLDGSNSTIILKFKDPHKAQAAMIALDEILNEVKTCPGHGRAECVTCCWPSNGEKMVSIKEHCSITTENGSTFNWVKAGPLDAVKGEE